MKKVRVIAASLAVVLGITASMTSNAATATTYSVQTTGGNYVVFSGVPNESQCDLSNQFTCIIEHPTTGPEVLISKGVYVQ